MTHSLSIAICIAEDHCAFRQVCQDLQVSAARSLVHAKPEVALIKKALGGRLINFVVGFKVSKVAYASLFGSIPPFLASVSALTSAEVSRKREDPFMQGSNRMSRTECN